MSEPFSFARANSNASMQAGGVNLSASALDTLLQSARNSATAAAPSAPAERISPQLLTAILQSSNSGNGRRSGGDNQLLSTLLTLSMQR